jgi:hypothetical protein
MRTHYSKKNDLQPWRCKRWVIPPAQNAEFVCAMEDILDLYQRPYDPRRPVVCFDEASKQLVGQVTPPAPPEPGRPAREDYEYVRRGTANLFMLSEPLANWRQVKVTTQRTIPEFAQAIRELVDVHYPHAERIALVLDNLNTHKPASLYATFPPAEAHRLLSKLEIHHTPKHGSWLNMAEIELSVLAMQCLKCRIPNLETVRSTVQHWCQQRNRPGRGINWRFTTPDARIKLKRLYPLIESG